MINSRNSINVLFLLFLFFVTFVSNAQTDKVKSKTYLEFKLSDYEVYILDSKYFKDYLSRYDSITGFWNPAKSDISLCEFNVKSYLFKKFKEENLFLYSYAFKEYNKDYKRQYFGYFNNTGDRCMHIIFVRVIGFRESYKWKLRRYPYHIYDAGQSLFKLTYNLDREEFYNFRTSE